ncbi:MAG: OmpH family outer membrane protein [Synergistaceae bacterium]|nr:OmpH family outer membrane protein [Synergistaceae bacterium]
MFLRKFLVTLALLTMILNLSGTAIYAATDKIGFIDTQRILVAHPKYESSQKYVDDFITEKSEAARNAAEKETDPSKRMEIIDTARRESGLEELRVMNPITEDINKVIETVAKSRGVTVVIERVYVFFGGIDITEDVIKGVKAIK